jgi:hypothetical protein
LTTCSASNHPRGSEGRPRFLDEHVPEFGHDLLDGVGVCIDRASDESVRGAGVSEALDCAVTHLDDLFAKNEWLACCFDEPEQTHT